MNNFIQSQKGFKPYSITKRTVGKGRVVWIGLTKEPCGKRKYYKSFASKEEAEEETKKYCEENNKGWYK